jgi:hypothetical protein
MTDVLPPIPRRDMLRSAVKLAGSGWVLVALKSEQASAQPKPQLKLAKNEANYQDHPNGQQRCEACAYYIPPVACRVVRGEVSPNGWCSQFQATT